MKDFLVKRSVFEALFRVKQKNLYQEARDTLFANATPAVKRLRQQATTEARAKARREWKDAQIKLDWTPGPSSPVQKLPTKR